MTHVLDASAVLAFLHDEPGANVVKQALEGAQMSAVNWSEVLQKAIWKQVDIVGMQQEFEEIGVTIKPFTASQAEIAAQLWKATKKHGLSFADRACLALATENKAPILTADKAWIKLDLKIKLRFLR